MPTGGKKHIKVIASLYPASVANLTIRLNNDSSASYYYNRLLNGSTGQSTGSEINTNSGADTSGKHLMMEFVNISDRQKLGNYSVNTTSVETTQVLGSFRYINTNSIASTVNIISTSGDYAVGSEVIVLGHD